MKWSEIVAEWKADARNADLDDLTSDMERYREYPNQVYNILQSRGRDLAGSVAYWYAKNTLGFDPDEPKERDDKDPGAERSGDVLKAE